MSIFRYNLISFHWLTRVNLNWNRTNPCAGLCDVRQVPARPYPMQARFQLWWPDQTFYSTRPIIKAYFTYPTRLVQCDVEGLICSDLCFFLMATQTILLWFWSRKVTLSQACNGFNQTKVLIIWKNKIAVFYFLICQMKLLMRRNYYSVVKHINEKFSS